MKIAEVRCNSRAALTDREIAGCFNAYLGRISRVHLIGGADVAAELDAKRAIKQGSELAAGI